MSSQLSFTHLRFDVVADTAVTLGNHFAGSNLRNALANVIRHTTCPETERRGKPTPEHAATCPACWLLSAEIDPGSVVRAYAVIPPMPSRKTISAGESFSFGLTLFGDGFQFLPYFVLAVGEAGRLGVGPGRGEGNGRFTLQTIYAFDPLQGMSQQLLVPGDNLVMVPDVHVGWTAVADLSDHVARQTEATGKLTIQFLTPLRLEEKQQRYKSPDFSVFFRRLLYRIDDLGRQFAGQERRDRAEVTHLNQLADQVRLVKSNIHWHELWVQSSRRQGKTPHGGLVGQATYWAADWQELLPWLIFGQGVQVGKSAARGNGAYQLLTINLLSYWQWMQANA